MINTIKLPQFEVIKQYVRGHIKSEHSPVGTRTPSENELSYLNAITEFTNESIEFENLNWSVDDELVETQSEYWQYEFPDEEYVNYEVCLEAITVNNCSST